MNIVKSVGAALVGLAVFCGGALAQLPPTALQPGVLAGSKTLAATNSSSPTALPAAVNPNSTVTLYNSGTKDAWFAVGGDSIAATVCAPCGPGAGKVPAGTTISVWTPSGSTKIAVITNGSDTTNVEMYQSSGLLNFSIVNPAGGTGNLIVGTSTITGGSTGRILYDNGGVLGEYAVGTGVATALGNTAGGAGGFALVGTTPPTGTAGGSLAGTYPNPSLAAINSVGTSLAVGGCTIGTDALCATGTATISGRLSSGGLTDTGNGAASAPAMLLNGTVFTGGSGTTNFPQFFIQPSGATAATTLSTAGTAIGVNMLSGFTGNLMDLRINGSQALAINSNGSVISGGSLTAGSTTTIGWSARGILTSPAAATLQLGAVDAAAPVPQTLQPQNVVAGTVDTAGANFTISGSRGTGTGVGGSILFQTAAASGSTGSSQNALVTALSINSAGLITTSGSISAGSNIAVPGGNQFQWTGRGILSSPAAGSIRLGGLDAASPVAQTFGVQNVATGTSNTAGVNWTMNGSLSTGSGASGDIIIQTGGTGAGATAQNSLVTAMTIKGATQAVLWSSGVGSDATKTDASLCIDATTNQMYRGSGTLGVCLGTSSERYKHDVEPLDAGLAQIMAIRPVQYKLNADHGDPDKLLYGFTAEQGGSVIPALVGDDSEGRANTFDYLGMVPVLTKAVQELKADNDNLRQKLHDLRRTTGAR